MSKFIHSLGLVSLLALSACASMSGRDDGAPVAALTPTEQYPIEVRDHPDEILLAAHGGGLSPAQEDAVAALAARWRDQGSGAVTIQAPLGGDPIAGRATAEQARRLLIDEGVPVGNIRLVGYNNAPDQPVAVIVGFAALEAIGPECGQAWENLSKTGSNKVYKQFGCATAANFAAQIANPADLVRPHAMDPADATRRSTVLNKYRQGQITSTPADEQARATTSSD